MSDSESCDTAAEAHVPVRSTLEQPLGDEDIVDGILTTLDRSGVVDVQVWGRSMFPFVWPGATVTITRIDGSPLERGEIVLLQASNTLAVHRVVSTHPLRTQGDAFTQPDLGDHHVVGRARTAVVGRWHVPRLVSRATNQFALVAAPLVRRARPLARHVVAMTAGGPILAAIIRTLDRPRIELLQPDHLPLVRRYLLSRGQRPTRAVLAAWRAAAGADRDLFTVIVLRRRGIVGSLTAERRPDGDSWRLFDLWAERPGCGDDVASELVRRAAAEASKRGASNLFAHEGRERGPAWSALSGDGYAQTEAAPEITPRLGEP